MCVYSMVVDHYLDKWRRPEELPVYPFPSPPLITPAEIEEFRRLLDRAREYDQAHGQSECETEQKRQRIRKLAEELGVDASFV